MFENITITIKDILQSYSFPTIPHNEPWKALSVNQIIENGKDKFFDFKFPWYAEDKTGLSEFEELFLRKNYMKQIGQETTAQFKLYLQARLMEKMPLYKQLYESSLIEYDPLINRKITTIHNEVENVEKGKESENSVVTNANGNTTESNSTKREASGTGNQDTNRSVENSKDTTQTGERTNEINNQSIHSENPEITMANKDYASSMDRERKAEEEHTNLSSNISGNETTTENTENTQSITDTTEENNKSDSEAESTENATLTENEKEERNRDRNETVEGFYGDSQAEAILKYRETILNLNEMICNDMDDLFLGYYGGMDYGINW